MKEIGHHPPPVPTYAKGTPVVSKDFTFYLKVSGLNQALDVCRFIVTKFYRGIDLSEADYTLLWLLLEYFKSTKNYHWFKDHELDFLVTEESARIIATYKGEFNSIQQRQMEILIPQIVMNPREFLGRLGDNSYDVQNFIRVRNSFKNVKPKQRRTLGVGYRDKGNTRNPPFDGSPGWKEVSRSEGLQKMERYRMELFLMDIPAWVRARFKLELPPDPRI